MPDMPQTLASVILCTHNPRGDYLRRTLAALRGQTMSTDRWELLLVDNASTEPLAVGWDLTWHSQARHIREDEPGLTAARLRGIREARGEMLVFVDDDNVLAPDYLATVESIMSAFPYLGVWGAGRLEPEFESEPPSEIVSRLPMLALRSVSAIRWSNHTEDYSIIPWGAGLCVRMTVADRYQNIVEKLGMTALLDRRGQHLFCGGDDLFSWASVEAGHGFGIFPALQITHLISARRLNQKYFLRLIHDHAHSHGILKYLLTGDSIAPAGLPHYLRIVLHGIRNGLFSAQCQWAESKGEASAMRLVEERQLRPIEDSV